MTAQDHDYVEYLDELYSILDVYMVGRIGRPILLKYGITPFLVGSTANNRGYKAEYLIADKSLFMTSLSILGGKETKYIGKIAPKHVAVTTDGDFFETRYENLHEKVELDGHFAIGRDLESYTHPDASINYKKVLLLEFKQGHLISINDISEKIAVLRDKAMQALQDYERTMPEAQHYLKYTTPEYRALASEAEELTKLRLAI
jgi:hypothetical protein